MMTLGELLRRINQDSYVNQPPERVEMTWDWLSRKWYAAFLFGVLDPSPEHESSGATPADALRALCAGLNGHWIMRTNHYHQTTRGFFVDGEVTCDDALDGQDCADPLRCPCVSPTGNRCQLDSSHDLGGHYARGPGFGQYGYEAWSTK